MCSRGVLKILNGLSPHAYCNYFIKVNNNHSIRANKKDVALLKVRSESRRKAFSFQGAMIFSKMTDEMEISSINF